MPLKQVCKTDVVSVEPTASVRQAAQVMRERHVGSVVVAAAKNGARRPLGMLTDRDIVALCVARGIDPDKISVDDVMMRNPQVARVNDGIYATIEKMCNTGVRRMPVVDEQDSLVGIVSIDDLYALLATELAHLASISEQQIARERSGIAINDRF